MTLSVPSAWAASTRASMPPKSSTDVAVAVSVSDPPPPDEPPSSEPHAVRVSPAVTTATAVRRVLRRTCPPEVAPYLPSAPLTLDGRRRDCGGTSPIRGGYGTRTSHEPSAGGSATGELRLARAVLEEGLHARPLVLGVEQPGEELGLQRQSLVEGAVQPAVDGPLGRGERQGRPGRELARHGHRGRVDLVVRDDGVGETELEGLLRTDVPAGEDQVLGLGRADQPRQALGPTGARDDPEQDLRLADLRARAHDPEVGAEGELVAAAEGVAGDGGDDRLRDVGDRPERVLQLAPPGRHARRVQLRHRLDVR